MPLPAIDVIAAKVKGHLQDGDSWMNVLHFDRPAVWDATAQSDLADDLVAAYLALTLFQGTGTKLQEIEFVDLSVTPPVAVVKDIVPDQVGTSPGDNMPAQIAGLVSWRTGTGGRAGRGRTYLPGLAENANTAEAGPHDDFIAAAQEWADAVIVAGDGLVVVSYFDGYTWSAGPPYKKIPTPRVVPVVSDVTSGSPARKWATMRSRNNQK